MKATYAIITFRNSGPIKNWSDLRGAHTHNARTKPIPHAIPDRPGPLHLIGSGDLVDDVKQKLIEHGIDPHNLRENGVLAYEAVLTASPSFFQGGDEHAQAERLDRWTKAQVAFSEKLYGNRIASMVLHLDEQTPHVHLVVVPLALVDDKRRKDRGWRYSLVGATISGPGKFDEMQDDYAAAMAPFGLVRGERGSGRKYEPYSVTIARVAEREKAAADREMLARNAEAAAEQHRQFWEMLRAGTEKERQDVKQIHIEATRIKAETERERAAIDEAARATAARLAAQAAEIEADQRRIKNQHDLLLMSWKDFREEEAALEKDRATATKALEDAEAIKAYLKTVMASARVFADAANALQGQQVPHSVAEAFRAARVLATTAQTAKPANDQRPTVRAAAAAVQQQAHAIGF